MKTLHKILLCACLICGYTVQSQNLIQAYLDRSNLVTQANITTNLQDFASYGVKTTGSIANANTLNWLKNKYLSFGYTASQIVEDPFSFVYGSNTINSKNLVVTKTGTVYPNTYVIICGHFDTVSGPGVNDNGSGVSVILEIARILKDVPTEYSIKFINFSGEEQGLYGSEHYVANVANATSPKMDIKVVFNIDQVGGVAGQVNNTIRCDVDYYAPNYNNADSQLMANQLAACTAHYSGGLLTDFYGAFSSDYEPFHQDGYVVTGFYEYNVSSRPHTSMDTFVNMDPVFVYKVAKAAVGAAQHFAVASTVLDVKETTQLNNDFFEVYPNPASSYIQLQFKKEISSFEFEIYDSNGRLVLTEKNQTKINISSLSTGVYVAKLKSDDKVQSKKFIVEK